MYDLTRFSLTEMIECGSAIREMGCGVNNEDTVGMRIATHLYENLIVGETGHRAAALVQYFKTLSFSELTSQQRTAAESQLGKRKASASLKCFALRNGAGDKPEWNSRSGVGHHAVVPLEDGDSLQKFPVIAQFIVEIGLDAGELIKSDPEFIVNSRHSNYNIFHANISPESLHLSVPEESDYPIGVHSIIAFGGVLPPGDLFAFFIFVKIPTSKIVAAMFRTVALNAKLALLSASSGVKTLSSESASVERGSGS